MSTPQAEELVKLNKWLSDIQAGIHLGNSKAVEESLKQLKTLLDSTRDPALLEELYLETKGFLSQTISKNQVRLLDALLKVDAIKNHFIDEENSLLFLATLDGSIDIVERLLKEKSVRENLPESGSKIFNEATAHGHLAIVELLLGEDSIRKIIANNNEVLEWAAINGRLNVLQRLLRIGSLAERVADNDNKILRDVIKDFNLSPEDKLRIVDCLLKIDSVTANIASLVSIFEDTAQDKYAAIFDRFLQLEPIRKQIADRDNALLFRVVINGQNKIFDRLLREKSVRELVAIGNNKILFEAIAHGHFHMAERLLREEAVLALASKNNGALDAAATNGHLPLLEFLLKKPAIAHHVSDNNNEVLRNAANEGQVLVVDALLKIPSVLKGVNDNNDEALRMAAQNGHSFVLYRLIEAYDNQNLPLPNIDVNYRSIGESVENDSTAHPTTMSLDAFRKKFNEIAQGSSQIVENLNSIQELRSLVLSFLEEPEINAYQPRVLKWMDGISKKTKEVDENDKSVQPEQGSEKPSTNKPH